MGRYRIVPERSSVAIHATSSLHPIDARNDGLEGYLDLDVADGGRIDVQVPPAGHLSLPVEQLRSGNPLQDRELQRRIDGRRFRTIDGHLSGISEDGAPGRYRVSGDVIFRGVTRAYEDLMVISVLDDGALRLEGEASFDIRDFGMDPPSILLFRVHPTVRVGVDIVAVKED